MHIRIRLGVCSLHVCIQYLIPACWYAYRIPMRCTGSPSTCNITRYMYVFEYGYAYAYNLHVKGVGNVSVIVPIENVIS